MKMKIQIRFAPIIRVSTESQEKRGESLRTQHNQIRQWINSKAEQGWIVPDGLWERYSGQEHATTGQDREKLDNLIEDARKGLFDAVIVCDASRWSRDNLDSKQRLKTLRDLNIRFFVGTQEFNLFNPQQRLFLGIATEMNEFFALEQARKSLENRIERARRGIPTNGNLPFGRTYDVEKGEGRIAWGLDDDKEEKIKEAAKMYLDGGSIPDIAVRLDMKPYNLWKVLTQRAGPDWEIKFRSEKLGINETVSFDIPPLLDSETIQKIKERIQANKTYTHGQTKNSYLLGRMVFCSSCGMAMSGQTNRHGKRYYRHPKKKLEECPKSSWAPADQLEDAVIVHLFSTFGNQEALEEAVIKAIPNKDEIKELSGKKSTFEKKLSAIRVKTDKIAEAIATETIKRDQAERILKKYAEQEKSLADELNRTIHLLETHRTEKQIRRSVKSMRDKAKIVRARDKYTSYRHLPKMTPEHARILCQQVFGGLDTDNKRLGVYLYCDERGWNYIVKGKLIETDLELLPMSNVTANNILEISVFDVGDDYNPWTGKKGSDISSSYSPTPALP